jgi:hypothetical protein
MANDAKRPRWSSALSSENSKSSERVIGKTETPGEPIAEPSAGLSIASAQMLPRCSRRQTFLLGAAVLAAGWIPLDAHSATAGGLVELVEPSSVIPLVAPDEPGGPAVTSKGPNLLDVFVRGKDNDELVQRHWDGRKWSGWINLGGDLASAPAVTSKGPHVLDVFVRGRHNHELVHRYWDGSRWSGWDNLGGSLAAGPAVTSRAPNLLDVFVRGKDNDELVQRHWDGRKWSGWINLGGDLA